MVAIITEECLELDKQIDSYNTFIENSTQQYMCEMDNLRYLIDNGELTSDYAIQEYTESADNKFIAKIKLAIAKLKDAVIKFFKEIMLKIKTSSLMPRLRKCQDDIEKYKEYFPSNGYIDVNITDDELEHVKEELQQAIRDFITFYSKTVHAASTIITSTKGENIATKAYAGAANISSRQVDFVLSRLAKISPNAWSGGKIKISNISKSIDKRISSITKYDQQRLEITQMFDDAMKKMSKMNEPEIAREIHEACVALTNASQRAIQMELTYCGQIIKQVNSLVAEAKKAKHRGESCELDRDINECNILMETAIQQYMSEMDNLRIQVDEGQILSEAAIDYYTEATDNKFVNKIRGIFIKLIKSVEQFFVDKSMKLKAMHTAARLKLCTQRVKDNMQYLPKNAKIEVSITPENLEKVSKYKDEVALLLKQVIQNISSISSEKISSYEEKLRILQCTSPDKFFKGTISVTKLQAELNDHIVELIAMHNQAADTRKALKECADVCNKNLKPDQAKLLYDTAITYVKAVKKCVDVDTIYANELIKQADKLISDAKKVRKLDESVEFEFLL